MLALALVLRLGLAARLPFMYDEYLWAGLSDEISSSPANLPVSAFHHPAGQAYWNRLGVEIFGRNLIGYRFASALLGTLAVFVVYSIGSKVWDRKTGLSAAALLALNEYHLGVSQLCVQKSCLTFALLSVLLTLRAVERPTAARYAALGVVIGLGLLTGASVAVWIPILAVSIVRRRGLREVFAPGGAWIAALAALLTASPYLAGAIVDRTGAGLDHQLAKLSGIGWSWAPTALFIRPLYFHAVEGTISEYAAMSTAPGVIVLAGALAGGFLRGREARLVLALGWFPFLFFSLFSRPDGEFFWADFCLPPFVLLTAAAVRLLRKASGAAAVLAVSVHAWTAVELLRTRDRYFPLDWGDPPRAVVESYRTSQHALIARFKSRDHLELSTFAGRPLPVYEYHLSCLAEYRDALDSKSSDPELVFKGWLAEGDDRNVEIEWVRREISRFEGAFPERRR